MDGVDRAPPLRECGDLIILISPTQPQLTPEHSVPARNVRLVRPAARNETFGGTPSSPRAVADSRA